MDISTSAIFSISDSGTLYLIAKQLKIIPILRNILPPDMPKNTFDRLSLTSPLSEYSAFLLALAWGVACNSPYQIHIITDHRNCLHIYNRALDREYTTWKDVINNTDKKLKYPEIVAIVMYALSLFSINPAIHDVRAHFSLSKMGLTPYKAELNRYKDIDNPISGYNFRSFVWKSYIEFCAVHGFGTPEIAEPLDITSLCEILSSVHNKHANFKSHIKRIGNHIVDWLAKTIIIDEHSWEYSVLGDVYESTIRSAGAH